MKAIEKAVLLESTIKQLYVNEGRSISYIYRLLGIDRHTLSKFIHDSNFTQVNQEKRKIREFLGSYRDFIIRRMKDGWTNREIYTYCKVGHDFFKKVLEYDVELLEIKKNTSCTVITEYTEYEDELWKTILGYPNYEVSNYGRIRTKNGLIKPILNKLHDRFYVGVYNDEGKRANLSLARVVAHAFCEKHDGATTVNHKDGNKHNNKADNLEWVTYSENLKHSYDVLKRIHKGGRKIDYVIEYKNKYMFKTIAAFARFARISTTQATRWLEEPQKHNLRKIAK